MFKLFNFKVKECPKCDSHDLVFYNYKQNITNRIMRCVGCRECEFTGPSNRYMRIAVIKWNRIKRTKKKDESTTETE